MISTAPDDMTTMGFRFRENNFSPNEAFEAIIMPVILHRNENPPPNLFLEDGFHHGDPQQNFGGEYITGTDDILWFQNLPSSSQPNDQPVPGVNTDWRNVQESHQANNERAQSYLDPSLLQPSKGPENAYAQFPSAQEEKERPLASPTRTPTTQELLDTITFQQTPTNTPDKIINMGPTNQGYGGYPAQYADMFSREPAAPQQQQPKQARDGPAASRAHGKPRAAAQKGRNRKRAPAESSKGGRRAQQTKCARQREQIPPPPPPPPPPPSPVRPFPMGLLYLPTGERFTLPAVPALASDEAQENFHLAAAMAHARLRDVLARSLDNFGEHDGAAVLRLLMDEIRACTIGVTREFVSAIELSRSEEERVWLGEWVRFLEGEMSFVERTLAVLEWEGI